MESEGVEFWAQRGNGGVQVTLNGMRTLMVLAAALAVLASGPGTYETDAAAAAHPRDVRDAR